MPYYIAWFILLFISRNLLGGGAAVLLFSVYFFIYHGPEFSWILPAMGLGIIGVGYGVERLADRVMKRIDDEDRRQLSQGRPAAS